MLPDCSGPCSLVLAAAVLGGLLTATADRMLLGETLVDPLRLVEVVSEGVAAAVDQATPDTPPPPPAPAVPVMGAFSADLSPGSSLTIPGVEPPPPDGAPEPDEQPSAPPEYRITVQACPEPLAAAPARREAPSPAQGPESPLWDAPELAGGLSGRLSDDLGIEGTETRPEPFQLPEQAVRAARGGFGAFEWPEFAFVDADVVDGVFLGAPGAARTLDLEELPTAPVPLGTTGLYLGFAISAMAAGQWVRRHRIGPVG